MFEPIPDPLDVFGAQRQMFGHGAGLGAEGLLSQLLSQFPRAHTAHLAQADQKAEQAEQDRQADYARRCREYLAWFRSGGTTTTRHHDAPPRRATNDRGNRA